MKPPGKDRTDIACAALCLALCAVAAGYCLRSGDQMRWPDERIYDGIARRMLAGLGFTNDIFQPSAYRPPGYPFILYLVYHLHASVLAAKLLNAAALGATAWLLSRIVATVAPAGRLFAPLLILCYPAFIFMTGVLVPQILGGFLLVLALYGLIRRPGSLAAALATGVLFGALILMIPSFALVLVCLALIVFLARKRFRLRGVAFLAVLCLAAALTVAPWVARSSLLFGRFVFISTNSGINLLYGNSENTTYNSGVVDISKYSETGVMNEAGIDAYYEKSALIWIREHPAAAASLYMKKVANYFNFRGGSDTSFRESKPQSRLVENILMFLCYYLLLFAALFRCALWKKYAFTWPEALLYLLYFGNALLAAIVYTRLRYRIPFDFLLVAMVAMFIGRLRTASASASEKNLEAI